MNREARARSVGAMSPIKRMGAYLKREMWRPDDPKINVRKQRPGLVSALFRPLLGRHADGPVGKAIDVFTVFATLFGTTTSLGLGALLAEIERRLNRDNAQPRKRYVSPATREAAYAAYVDRLRRRIEARGTQNFPELAGRKLYGELTMLVTVDAEGRLLGAEILQGSGIDVLDRRAQAIVTGIDGFGRFSEAMRAQADQIVLPSRFQFGHDETLRTSR